MYLKDQYCGIVLWDVSFTFRNNRTDLSVHLVLSVWLYLQFSSYFANLDSSFFCWGPSTLGFDEQGCIHSMGSDSHSSFMMYLNCIEAFYVLRLKTLIVQRFLINNYFLMIAMNLYCTFQGDKALHIIPRKLFVYPWGSSPGAIALGQ